MNKITPILVIMNMIFFCGAVRAGNFEDGLAAAKIGQYEEAVRQFEVAAKNNHPAAQFNLGILFLVGKGAEVNFNKSAKWFHLSIKHSDTEESNRLESLYLLGLVFKNWRIQYWQSNNGKIHLGSKVPDSLNPDNLEYRSDNIPVLNDISNHSPKFESMSMAKLFSKANKKQPKKLLLVTVIAAHNGLQAAQYEMADNRYHGRMDVPMDAMSAADWYTLAASGPKPTAAYLFLCQYNQSDIESCISQWEAWLVIPLQYLDTRPGKGRPEYFRLHKLAVENNDVEAMYNLAKLLNNGRYGDIWETQDVPIYLQAEKSKQWFAAAAALGHAPSQYELGTHYWFGLQNTEKNRNKGETLLQLSAAQGNKKALTFLSNEKISKAKELERLKANLQLFETVLNALANLSAAQSSSNQQNLNFYETKDHANIGVFDFGF